MGFFVDGIEDRAERFQPGVGIHIGMAIAIRGGGLVAPAIHDADKLSLDELMARLRDLVARARSGACAVPSCRTRRSRVTKLGEQGVETVFGVIYPPQVALLGFGTPVERPWAITVDYLAQRLAEPAAPEA
jgi:pyruvate dehydrogenase E2 component (dihydrolipoamide acetyltransferase)